MTSDERFKNLKEYSFKHPGKVGKPIIDKIIEASKCSKVKCPYCKSWNNFSKETVTLIVLGKRGVGFACKGCREIIYINFPSQEKPTEEINK